MPLSFSDFTNLLRGLPADAPQEQVNQAAKAAEAGTPLEHIWAWANKPLVGGKDSLLLAHEHGPDEGVMRRTAEDLGASLTAPMNVAATALGVGAGAAGARGLLGISKAARVAEGALSVPFVAEGAYHAATGETPGEKLGGLVEAGLGAHGLNSAASHAFPADKVVSTYMKEKGFAPLPREPFDANAAKATGDAYEAMPHDPRNPEVYASYEALKNQIKEQYKFLRDRAGLKMEPFNAAKFNVDNYPNSEAMQADVRKNNHLHYYPTEVGFGGKADEQFADHPMLQVDPETGMTANDMFRAVHDYFGHAAEGSTFKQTGEHQAYQAHKDTLSPAAHGALATETKGQNSWLHSGPHLRDAAGNIPENLPPEAKPYAQQKAGLLPEFRRNPAEVLPQGDELARGVDKTSSTPQTGASPRTGISTQPSPELSPEIAQQVKQLHDANGGATFNLAQGKSLVGEPYYSVSAYPDRSLILDHAPSEQELSNYIHKNIDLLSKPENSVGTWFNPEDKKHYLDVSITEPDRAKALQLGAKHGQLAIFDLKNLDTIDVPKEGMTAPKMGATANPNEATTPKPNVVPGGSTALAVAAPAASAAIDDSDPNDPNQSLKHYGKLAFDLLGAAGAVGTIGAAIRKTPQAPLKAHAARGAAYMLLGGPKTAWMQRMAAEGVAKADLPIVRANAEKILATQLAKAETKMPTAKKLLASFDSGKAEMGWYDQVHKELKELFGQDAPMVAQLLAATSSNSTVKSNVTLALKAYMKVKAGEPVTEGFLPAVVKQINRVAAGQPLEGRKIDNFARALVGDPDAVVVDRWMLRAFGFTHDAPTPHEYDVIETAVKELAKQRKVSPRQMQAAIWFGVKNAAEAGANRPASPPYGQLLRSKLAQQNLPY